MKIPKELYYISKRAGKAIAQYDMLHEGDKILVAVSGGKDSLTLLDVLTYRQTFVPIHYQLIAVHIDSGIPGSSASLLQQHLASKDIPYHIEKIDIVQEGNWNDVNCFWCSWNRRKTLFQLADKFGCNNVALGHHMDDIIETILLNLFFQGEISSMKPKQVLFEGKITIIRPLALEEEQNVTRYAKRSDLLKFDTSECPHNDNTKRTIVKNLIKQLEKINPDIKKNIFNSLQNIKRDYLLNEDGNKMPDIPANKSLSQKIKKVLRDILQSPTI